MLVYDPSEKILEDAKNKSNAILKDANQKILSIRTNNKKEVSQHISDVKAGIVKDLETESLITYSKKKIDYDKDIQEALSKKYLELKEAILEQLSNDSQYAKILNQRIKELLSEQRKGHVYANLDFELIDPHFSPKHDASMRHGFMVELEQRTYYLDVDYLVENYIKTNPPQA